MLPPIFSALPWVHAATLQFKRGGGLQALVQNGKNCN
jgi:hypothetical protein